VLEQNGGGHVLGTGTTADQSGHVWESRATADLEGHVFGTGTRADLGGTLNLLLARYGAQVQVS